MDSSNKFHKNDRWRFKIHEVIFEADTKVGRIFDIVLIIAILLSVVVVMLDSIAEVSNDFGYDFKKMDGRLIPTRIEIVPANEEGKKTVLYIKEIKFNVDLPESFFSQQKMKRVR